MAEWLVTRQVGPKDDAVRDGELVEQLVACVAARAQPTLEGVDTSLDLPPAARRALAAAIEACLAGPGQ